MLVFIFKSTACLLAFLLFYKLVLEKEKMHKFNRFYLLTALVLSFCIPLVTFTAVVEVEPFIAPTEELVFSEIPFQEIVEEPVNYLPYILGAIYTLGVLFFLTLFVKNCIQMGSKVRQNKKVAQYNIVHVLLQQTVIPHTFLKYIFLNKADFEADKIPLEVLLHEEAHAVQKHSLDVLFIEFLQVFFWFNPLIYLAKHSIKLNHEFLADEAVLHHGVSTTDYGKILLDYSLPSHKNPPLLANSINYSSIKKRFTVMKKRTSKQSIALRSLFLLPLFAVLLYSFSNKETQEVLVEEQSEQFTVVTAPQTTDEGATEKMMQEYRDYIKNYQDAHKKVVWMGEYNRIKGIYGLMTEKQKASVQDHTKVIRQLPDLKITKRKKPSQTEFDTWKNAEKFAIWVDSKNVPNSELDKYSVDDFVHFNGSFVYNNARSDKFPQEYQYHLYTKQGFENTFLKAGFSKYSSLLKKYNTDKDVFLKSGKTDNSELRLLHSRLWKMYKQFTPEEIKKYNPETPESYPYIKTKAISTQQKATPKQVAEYNSIVKKLMSQPEDKRIIKQKDLKRIKYIYSLMTDEQKRNAEPFPKLAPPPPPPAMDTIYTYNSLAKRTKFIPANRKNNLQRLKGLYGKMSTSQKEKVESPSNISNYIARINSLSGAQLEKANKVLNKIKANAQSKGRKFYSAAEYKELQELYGEMLNNSVRVKKGEKSNIPPPLPVSIKVGSEETIKAREEFYEKAKTYGKAVQSYSKKGEGSIEELQKTYKEVMNHYNEFKKLSKGSFPPPPPPPPAPKVKKGEKSNIPPPPPPRKATPEQLAEYNTLAKKYNAQPINDRVVKQKDLRTLESIYKVMTVAQKKSAEPFPECPPMPPSPVVQKGEKSNIPPPSKKPKTVDQEQEKTGFIDINNEKHYYVTDKKGKTQYYNRWGVLVDKDGKSLRKKQTKGHKVLKDQVISKVYKDDKVVSEFKVPERLKTEKSGYLYMNSETYFYSTDKKGNTKYYNKWGVRVKKDGTAM